MAKFFKDRFKQRLPADYLAAKDVAIAVFNRVFQSGLEHYWLHGAAEGRSPSRAFDRAFDEGDYLTAHSDMQQAVSLGAFTSGFDHYLEQGAMKRRSPNLCLFQEAFCQSANPDVAAAVAMGAIADGL